ncbi:MAG: type II toxin-antitoxin system RelE/ParE family toxin [Myxococcales bacterium]|nr:type II toxin-antitoxin system RelE/ParE family toxin [Myxococcales bacterium]
MIVWTRSAVNDLDALRTIAELAPRSRGARRVIEAVSLLEKTAHLGRPGRVKGTRELVLVDVPYIVAYRVVAGTVEVLRVLHTARRWPRRLR